MLGRYLRQNYNLTAFTKPGQLPRSATGSLTYSASATGSLTGGFGRQKKLKAFVLQFSKETLTVSLEFGVRPNLIEQQRLGRPTANGLSLVLVVAAEKKTPSTPNGVAEVAD